MFNYTFFKLLLIIYTPYLPVICFILSFIFISIFFINMNNIIMHNTNNRNNIIYNPILTTTH